MNCSTWKTWKYTHIFYLFATFLHQNVTKYVVPQYVNGGSLFASHPFSGDMYFLSDVCKWQILQLMI